MCVPQSCLLKLERDITNGMGGTSMCSGVSGCTFAAAQHQHTYAFLKRHQPGNSTALRVSWRCGGACPSSWKTWAVSKGKAKKRPERKRRYPDRCGRLVRDIAGQGRLRQHQDHRDGGRALWYVSTALADAPFGINWTFWTENAVLLFFFLSASVLFVLLLCQEFRNDRQYMFVLFPVRLMVPVQLRAFLFFF